MYAENELMFPHAVIPALRRLRGARWQALVDHVLTLPQTHEDTLAFMLMMVRLDGCIQCETDSYRAMRGCSACAIQTLRRYKGSDDDLIALFDQALADVRLFAGTHPQFGIDPGDRAAARWRTSA